MIEWLNLSKFLPVISSRFCKSGLYLQPNPGSCHVSELVCWWAANCQKKKKKKKQKGMFLDLMMRIGGSPPAGPLRVNRVECCSRWRDKRPSFFLSFPPHRGSVPSPAALRYAVNGVGSQGQKKVSGPKEWFPTSDGIFIVISKPKLCSAHLCTYVLYR